MGKVIQFPIPEVPEERYKQSLLRIVRAVSEEIGGISVMTQPVAKEEFVGGLWISGPLIAFEGLHLFFHLL